MGNSFHNIEQFHALQSLHPKAWWLAHNGGECQKFNWNLREEMSRDFFNFFLKFFFLLQARKKSIDSHFIYARLEHQHILNADEVVWSTWRMIERKKRLSKNQMVHRFARLYERKNNPLMTRKDLIFNVSA